MISNIPRLLLPVTAFLMIAACRQAGPGIHVDKTLAALAPAGTKLAGGVDLARLRSAPLYQQNANAFQLRIPSEFAPVKQVFEQSSAILVAASGDSPVVLVHGNFSEQSLRSTLESRGMTQSKNGVFVAPGAGFAAWFPTAGVIEMGREDAISQPAAVLPEGIQERLRSLPAADQIWFVSTQGVPPSAIPKTSDIGAALGSIASYVTAADGGVGVDSGIHIQAHLNCASEKGAQQVHDALRGFLAIGRLTVRDDQTELLHAYDAVHIDQNGSVVNVHADLPPQLSQKVIQYANTTRLAIGK